MLSRRAFLCLLLLAPLVGFPAAAPGAGPLEVMIFEVLFRGSPVRERAAVIIHERGYKDRAVYTGGGGKAFTTLDPASAYCFEAENRYEEHGEGRLGHSPSTCVHHPFPKTVTLNITH